MYTNMPSLMKGDSLESELRKRPQAQAVQDHVPSDCMKCFHADEVAKHDRPDDCWLVINGKVYDITEWVPKHPGGSLLYVNAGHDCTQLFESYHPLYVRKMLSKYCIGHFVAGKVESQTYATQVLKYSESNGATDFYTTLKIRVEGYFKKKKINPRVHPHMFIKSVAIIVGLVICYFGTFFSFTNPLVSTFFAIGMGLLVAEVGVSIQHDCNHGSYGEWRSLAYVLSASLDMVGVSSFMWRQQHVVGHHVTTNVDQFDPDIRVKSQDVRRVTSHQPRHWYHSYQHIYLTLLYGLLALKSVFLDDFDAYISGHIGNVRVAKMTNIEFAVFAGGKIVYATYMLVLPSIYGVQNGWTQGLLYLLSQLVAGWALAFMFQVAHVVEEAEFPKAEISNGVAKVAKGWAEAQVATTTDFSPNSFFWTHFSGGLNYQIEHHLFPGVCHVHYPNIKPIVEATCKEFNVPYHCFPTFFTALKAHVMYLKKVGSLGFELRMNG